jgi:hypothetical protein
MERKIYLVVDGHSILKAGKVQEHLTALGGQITLFFLPPYSTDLDPKTKTTMFAYNEVHKICSRTHS